MQSETADFAYGPPPEELYDRCASSSLILAHSRHYVKTWRCPQNRKYITYRIVVRGGPSHNHSVQKSWWDLDAWYIRCASRQTDTQTRWSQYFTPSPYRRWSKNVNVSWLCCRPIFPHHPACASAVSSIFYGTVFVYQSSRQLWRFVTVTGDSIPRGPRLR